MTPRWPWVARSTLERAEAAHAREVELLERARAELRRDLVHERLRSSKLTVTIMRLKRDGAVILPAATVKAEKREPTAIERAIDDNPHFRRAPGLIRHTLDWAERELKKGVSEETIIETIQNWGRTDFDAEEAAEEADRL